MTQITVGSLFSGIGGLELGLERAGMRVVWQVEKDDYCRRVLAKHWPDVERFEDVKDVGALNLKPVDLICGGFPCQDISSAGKREGIKGARSGLWYEYARIIGELRPQYVLVENVSALLVRGLDAVLGELAEIGYDAEWHCIPASYVGAPHRRDRIWLLAYANGHELRPQQKRIARRGNPSLTRDDGPAQSLAHATFLFGDGSHHHTGGNRQGARTLPQSGNGSGSARRRFGEWWATEPRVGRVAHGVPRRVDRLRALGNAVVPQLAEYIGRLIVEADRQSQAVA